MKFGLNMEEGKGREQKERDNVCFIHMEMIILHFFSAVRPGFSQADYDGREGPDRRSTLPNIPCHVVICLNDTKIETSLTLRLIPRTFPENVASNGPQPPPCTSAFKEANASSKNM